MSLQKLVVVIVALLVFGLFAELAQFSQGAKAEENWLGGWNHRKSLEASTGIHVITTHYDAGNDVLGHVYLDGACQSDFDDIRFTGPDGQTLISGVTIRTKLNSDHAEFKVTVSGSPIYVYYGNPAAESYYADEALSAGSFGDTDQLTQSYVTATGGQISGIARASPVTGYATSLEAVVSSGSGTTAQMALLLMRTCEEPVGDPDNPTEGRRIVALTEAKSIPASTKHREVFTFDAPVPIFKDTVYGIALWASEGTTIWYETDAGSGSFFLAGGFSGDLVLYTGGLGNSALGRFLNYEMVDSDEQGVLFRDNADYTRSRGMWHLHYEFNGAIDVEADEGIGGSYAFNSTVLAPNDSGYGKLAFSGEVSDGNKRFWSGVVRLSTLPGLGSHVDLLAVLRYPWTALNWLQVEATEGGVQWQLSVASNTSASTHVLFGEVEVDTDYLVILSYETDGVDATSEVWVTKLSEPDLLLEAYPSAALTTTNDAFGDTFFIGAGTYGEASAISVFFDEMALTEDFPATFGAWENKVSSPVVPLSGWVVAPAYTNSLYMLSSTELSLSLELDAADANSKVTIYTIGVSGKDIGDYDYIDVTITGSGNARILMRFFLDNGTSFNVAYWKDPATLDTVNFDLSPYAGRTITVAYLALMTSDGLDADIEITQILLVANEAPPEISLSGWTVAPAYTNAPYALDSSESSLSLELYADDVDDKVTIYTLALPTVDLGEVDHIDVEVTGTDNARILMRFFLDNGTSFNVAYWKDPATLDTVNFDLSPYAGRTLVSAYVALMSSNGATANIEITDIALVVPTVAPLSGWTEVASLTNSAYALDSSASLLSLDLYATNTNSKATIIQVGVPDLNLVDYSYVDVAVTGSLNAEILMRFFMTDGTSFDVTYWKDPTTLNAITFDLSAYAGKMLRGDAYIALMSSDGTTASIDITKIAFISEALPPIVPLSGWTEVASLTNSAYALDSSASLLSLDLDAADTNSKATIKQAGAPALNLADYNYIDVTATGTTNAKILLRFFLDDGTSLDVTYWKDPATLNTVMFNLDAYSARTLRGDVYLALMSSDGLDASIDITDIAFSV
jgi:hypothetical protein